MAALTVAEIAELCDVTAEEEPDRLITGANTLEAAGPQEISFVASPKFVKSAANSNAGCLLVYPQFEICGPWSLLRAPDPRRAFAAVLHVLYAAPAPVEEIDPTAIIAPSAQVAQNCFIGPHVVVGEESCIGAGCRLESGTYIGSQVIIGEGTMLHPRVTLYSRVQIGKRVVIHSGAVLGADGFGFALAGDHYEKFPQVGTVVIEDDVEIGANCCIDRAALGVTRVGCGTKLDNLVHIAHNCNVGRHVVIAAQTGLSGSVTVGDYAVIGGQAGVGEKAWIAERAIVGGKSGILTSARVPAGEPVWGIPARPLRQHLKGLAQVNKMPELREEVRKLRQRLNDLTNNEAPNGVRK